MNKGVRIYVWGLDLPVVVGGVDKVVVDSYMENDQQLVRFFAGEDEVATFKYSQVCGWDVFDR